MKSEIWDKKGEKRGKYVNRKRGIQMHRETLHCLYTNLEPPDSHNRKSHKAITNSLAMVTTQQPPILASVATVAMRELEYNLQLFWQFQQEMTAKVSAAETSRKSPELFYYPDSLTFCSQKNPGKDTWEVTVCRWARMGTRPRFETEAKGNSKITDYKFHNFSLDKTSSFVGREIETRIRPNPGLIPSS